MKPKTAGHVHGGLNQTGRMTPANTSNTGLVSGAHILTLNGMQPVESLRVGDPVITRASGVAPITDIEVISMITPAVYIIAGSIGHSRQDRDTLVTADQTIMLRDWRAQVLFGQSHALARASSLIDGEFVRDLGQHPVTLHRIYCASPQIVYADGLELGTADACACDLVGHLV